MSRLAHAQDADKCVLMFQCVAHRTGLVYLSENVTCMAAGTPQHVSATDTEVQLQPIQKYNFTAMPGQNFDAS